VQAWPPQPSPSRFACVVQHNQYVQRPCASPFAKNEGMPFCSGSNGELGSGGLAHRRCRTPLRTYPAPFAVPLLASAFLHAAPAMGLQPSPGLHDRHAPAPPYSRACSSAVCCMRRIAPPAPRRQCHTQRPCRRLRLCGHAALYPLSPLQPALDLLPQPVSRELRARLLFRLTGSRAGLPISRCLSPEQHPSRRPLSAKGVSHALTALASAPSEAHAMTWL
jgi:hypothetical protein